jgi:hypothetical protein
MIRHLMLTLSLGIWALVVPAQDAVVDYRLQITGDVAKGRGSEGMICLCFHIFV